MDTRKPPRRIPLIPLTIFIALMAGLAVAGRRYYRYEKAHVRKDASFKLEAIADLKVSQIVNWRQERLSDATSISQNPFDDLRVVPFLQGRLNSGEDVEDIRMWMDSLRENYGYHDVVLADARGVVRLACGPSTAEIGFYAQARIAEILSSGRPFFSDFHSSGPFKSPHLDLYAPILTGRKAPGGIGCAGVLLFRINPGVFLYPLIQSWPVPSATAETLLVRREGDDVLFLNELRHRKGPALSLKFPVGILRLPAAMAVRGWEGLSEGVDYRGIQVLAVARKIPDSPWYLIAKEDLSEIFNPLQNRMISIAIILASLSFGAGLGFLFWLKKRDARFYKKQYEDEHNRLALIRHFEYLHKYANDIILLAGRDYVIFEANERASEAYGYTHEELVDMNIIELSPPQAERKPFETFQAAKEQKDILFETLHRRKDGTVFPVEISLRAFDVDGRIFYQAVIRDIAERKIAEELIQAALLEKDFLLREIHHRVKNNMQIISSLLNLQSKQFQDEKVLTAFRESQDRIRSMALVHEKLYKTSDFSRINFADYLKGLLSHLFLAYQSDSRRVRLNTEMEETSLDINTSIPCGLIVNELVSNALKYAFPGDRTGEITVKLKKADPDNMLLIIADNGVGLPPELNISQTESLGLQIVVLLVEQLEGRIELERQQGTRFRIFFRIPARHIPKQPS